MKTATITEVTDSDVAEQMPAALPVVQQTRAVAAASATPADLLRIAVESGADIERLERLMQLQERWEAKEAKKAYDDAFAAFKAEAVHVMKGRERKDGPLKGTSYAELHDVVDAVTPALSRNRLSSSWKLTKDEKDWIEITCYLRHAAGHEESVSMGGPPDAGPARNVIQARSSAITYLERITLKAICGVAEKGDDNDGAGAGRGDDVQTMVDKWTKLAKQAKTEKEARDTWSQATKELGALNDLAAFNEVKGIFTGKIADFKAAEAK